jgi:SPP1 family predicted phage head-tail adaptor
MSDPGRLDRRLVLEAPAETPDGAGGVTRSYETVTTLWASVVPVSSREQIEAAQRGARVTHRITLRLREGITTRHRLREGARVFRIVSLRESDARRRFLVIEAEERVG